MVANIFVREQDGISRSRWPITGGLALPTGVVTAPEALALTDADGQPLPLQARALTRWTDGSVRWLLLDLQADLAAYETKHLALAPCEPQARPPLAAEGIHDGEPLPRATGPLAVTGSSVRVVDADGHEWTEREGGAAAVEEHNALRATIRTCGVVAPVAGAKGIRWEARIDLFLGHSWTRTRFTYIVEDHGEPVHLRELSVVMDVDVSGEPTYCFAGPTAPWGVDMAPLCCPEPGVILQTDANDSRVVASDGRTLREQTLKNRGYVGVATEGSGVAIGLGEMWQSFPKALRATRASLEVGLLPPECEQDVALEPGIARTHTLVLTPYESPEALDEFMTTINTPILPQMAAADWNRTGIMPPVLPPTDTPVPFLEELTKALFTGFTTFSTRANSGVWGLGELNWGDFRAESYEARQVAGVYGSGTVWGNLEAQVPYGMLVQYLRTRRIEYLLHGLACARHEADVDTIHDAADATMIGGQHVHSVGHTAGPVGISHEWTSGIALAYLLTGDGRLQAVLAETGRHMLDVAERSELSAFCARDGGWLLIALCALYEALDDPRYLEAGSRVLRGLRGWIDAGATTLLPPTQHVHSPVHLFIALTGVADYLRLTGDDEAREALLVGGALALERGRNEAGFFFIADGQAYRNTGSWPTCHSLPVMDALHAITGDREWIEVGMHQARMLLRHMEARTQWEKEENWAQSGIYLAYAFGFFHTASELGLLEDI